MSQNPYRKAPQGHPIRMLPEWEHDPYHARRKWSEPTHCPDCGAIFQDGRWQRGAAPAAAEAHRCPACQRIQAHDLAGYLRLGGAFLAGHRQEIEQLVRHYVERQQAEHPLKRLIAINEQEDGAVELTFTDPHLTRGVGEALQSAYDGELDYHYQDGEYLLRVRWCRDA